MIWATASLQNEANHQNGESKKNKNIGPPESSFLLRKKFWVKKNRTTELGERAEETLSVICRGGLEFPKFPLEILTQLRLAAHM